MSEIPVPRLQVATITIARDCAESVRFYFILLSYTGFMFISQVTGYRYWVVLSFDMLGVGCSVCMAWT
jgi:hypothetical protein